MNPKAPLRKIVEREEYRHGCCPYGGASVWLKLECGHTAHRKRSQCPPNTRRLRCTECAWKAAR